MNIILQIGQDSMFIYTFIPQLMHRRLNKIMPTNKDHIVNGLP